MALDTSVRVLVAEDNANLRKVIVNIVKKIGYADVAEAEDGTSAWQQIQAGGIGLVLCDWSMPGLNGLDVLKHLRGAGGAIAQIPFVMVTAADTKDAIMTAGREGVDAYIIKPFSVQTISDKLEEAVVHRAGG